MVGVRDLDRLAEDLGDFLTALHRVPIDDGPIPGPHSFDRGGPVAVWDDETRAAIKLLEGRIDTSGALEVWEAAVATPLWTGPDVWVHGDMMAANLIVRDDRLCGVIDFGCSATGHPACDLTSRGRPSRDQVARDSCSRSQSTVAHGREHEGGRSGRQ